MEKSKSKILIVYYSRTGTTKKVAGELKSLLKCDSEEILDTKDRSGFMGYMRSGRDAIRRNLTEIKKIKKDPSLYDLVIVGTPNWASNISAPIRTYIAENCKKIRKVAFMVTMGGSSSDSVCRELGSVCRKKPVSCLCLRTRDVMQDACGKEIARFVREVRK
jgi:flavodoxin